MTPSEFKQWRAAMGWSQQVAADRLGINTRTLKYYEQGITSSGVVLKHVPISIGLAALALRFGRDVRNTAGGGNETD
jgi:transcriptional regulator with XRE-family HTH domain